jgi:hypothetical protein
MIAARPMSILGDLERLIIEHGSAAIMKERLALVRDQMESLEKEVADLKAKNAELEHQIARLRRQLEQATVPEEFTKHRGVLFRRLSNGKYEEAVYCPRCKIPMVSSMGATPFWCSSCKMYASFNGQELHKVMSEL